MRKVLSLFAALEKFSIRRSWAIVLLSLISISPALGQSGSPYVDSQQRFTIPIPPGWVARSFDAGGVSGVTIAHGADAYVQIFLQKGIDPASFLKALNNGVRENHPGYQVSDRGVKDVAGLSRMYIAGESPASAAAPHTQVYLETFAKNGYSFAVIASASDQKIVSKEKIEDYEVAQGMIQSLSFIGVTGRSANLTPPPAVTPPPPEIKSPPPVDNSNNLTKDQKKMAALDAALKNGEITEQEYSAKKKDVLFEQSAQPALLTKLKLLDQAFEGGVLTKEEYERKKKELGLEAASAVPPGEPVSAPVSASAIAPQPAAALPASTSSAELSPTPTPKTVAPASEPVAEPAMKSEAIIEPARGSWITHSDPTGFVVNLPPSWTIGETHSNGQISLHGTRGEEIMIWPLRIQKPQLNSRDTAVLTQSLALRFDALMPWGSVQNMRNAARTIGIGREHIGAAILSWADNPNGASAFFCALEAPSDVYENSKDSFVAILKSFHVVSNSAMKGVLPGASVSGRLMNFVNWSDPHEEAFSVSVPQGWHVIGGTYRLSPEDVRYAVVMDSPDGQLSASIGDSMVGAFAQPTQALTAMGLSEGSFQLLDDGSKLEILPYMSGQKFGRSYVETLVSRQCSHPLFTSSAPREDLASIFSQSANEEGFTDAFLTAGEVSFSCSLDGSPANGKFIAATLRIGHGESAIWFVYRLYGYVALNGREQDGEKVLAQILQTLKFNSKWNELKKDMTDPVVQQENPLSQEIQQRAEEDIIDDQRQTSEMIATSYEQRKRAYDAINHKLENAVLGTVEVEDRENGTRYKISDFGDYHYMTNDGYIYSADAPVASDASLRELLTLPPGI